MSDLEKYILEMRDKIDTDEPDSGHMKRFSKKLNADSRKIRKLNFRHGLQIAASIAIIMASGIVIVKSSKGSGKVAATPIVKEFQAANNYYIQQVNDKYEDIQSTTFDSKEEKELLIKELSEMDTYYQDLLKELNANPGDEQAMNALIQHYQIKLEVMDQILEQLRQLKTNNNQYNEKASI